MHMTEKLQTLGTYDGEAATDGMGRCGAELAYYVMHSIRAAGHPRTGNDTRAPAYIDYIYILYELFFFTGIRFPRTSVRIHPGPIP